MKVENIYALYTLCEIGLRNFFKHNSFKTK